MTPTSVDMVGYIFCGTQVASYAHYYYSSWQKANMRDEDAGSCIRQSSKASNTELAVRESSGSSWNTNTTGQDGVVVVWRVVVIYGGTYKGNYYCCLPLVIVCVYL